MVIVCQKVQPELDLQPDEYILREERVGDSHFHLILLNFQSIIT
jgi:hypothetical protein